MERNTGGRLHIGESGTTSACGGIPITLGSIGMLVWLAGTAWWIVIITYVLAITVVLPGAIAAKVVRWTRNRF